MSDPPPDLPRRPEARRTALLLLAAQARLDALVREEGPTRVRRARGLGLALSAGLALVAVAGLLGTLVERVDPALVYERGSTARTKLRALATLDEPPDLLVVGSSRVRRQIDPALLDAVLADKGFPVRSYNLGLSAMRHAECRTLVRRILQSEHRPRVLLVELIGNLTYVFGDPLHEENPESARVVAWHDLASTRLVVEAALASDMSAAQKREAVVSHLAHLGRAWFNLGIGIPLCAALLGHDDRVPSDPRRGYTPLDLRAEDSERLQESHQELIENGDLLRTKLERRLALEVPRRPPPLLLASLQDMAREAQEAGVELVYLLLPPHWTVEETEAFAGDRRFGLPPILDHRDPLRDPEFYTPKYLFNFNHLNQAGSELLTRRIAVDLARLWRR